MRRSHSGFRAIGFYLSALCTVAILFVLSIRYGTYTLSFDEISQAFHPDDKNYFTLMEYRLPRALLAIIIGGALAISGVLVQSVVRNPLASPDILGINNAAGLVAVTVLIFLPNLAFYWLPVFAFIGGVLSFILLWMICGFNFRPIKMAIIGVALSALWAAISHYLMLTNPVEINTAMLWLTGSLWGRSWAYVNVVLPWLLVLLPLPFIFCRDLDTLGLRSRQMRPVARERVPSRCASRQQAGISTTRRVRQRNRSKCSTGFWRLLCSKWRKRLCRLLPIL